MVEESCHAPGIRKFPSPTSARNQPGPERRATNTSLSQTPNASGGATHFKSAHHIASSSEATTGSSLDTTRRGQDFPFPIARQEVVGPAEQARVR
ncbi:hypothetical protein OH76DRAFT_819543 [Lentinus brumalis]|uniref:Uncharacterized protein n=1 Tax=Lentinus brumalis TaxID=2498619 RepID=A0A371D2P1_9APHY|nr:hypothetical protein OH76DRAFT_819543 [Polyporus brumalis]